VTAVHLMRVDPARKMARFYRLDVQPTLFGDFEVVKEWGRIGRAGQVRSSTPFPTSAEADAALARHRKVKERRGYKEHNHIALRSPSPPNTIVC
jgi:predicted DNA-binding WGR domain protein